MINYTFFVIVLFAILVACLMLNFKEFSKHERGTKSNAEFAIITSMMIIDALSVMLLKVAVRTSDIDTNALITVAIILMTFALLYIVNVKTILWMHTMPMLLIAVVTIVANVAIYTSFMIPTLKDVAAISNSFEALIKIITIVITTMSIITGIVRRRKVHSKQKEDFEEDYDM